MPDPPTTPRTGHVAAGALPAGLAALADAEGVVPELVPAATVVVLRDGPHGVEVLMVRRSSSLSFAGGMWVFPGGRIDPADHGPADHDPAAHDPVRSGPDLLPAARRAAAREAAEEAALVIDPDRLVWMSHWTPPERPGKRFATWFFVTALDDRVAEITVDGGEITEHGWMRPADAHRRRDEGEIELSPPTWITLWQLLGHASAADAVAAFAAADPEHFATRVARVGDEIHALYHGDAGYADTDAARPGPRHRLRMRGGAWLYERDLPTPR